MKRVILNIQRALPHDQTKKEQQKMENTGKQTLDDNTQSREY